MRTDKKILEQYAQAIREREDLKDRMRLIDAKIQNLESETDAVSLGNKGGRSLGRALVRGKGRIYSQKKSALLELRLRYEKMQGELDDMAIDVEEYIQSIGDSRLRQIMRLRYVEMTGGKQMTWREIAQHLGETEDSCRKAHDRYLCKEK